MSFVRCCPCPDHASSLIPNFSKCRWHITLQTFFSVGAGGRGTWRGLSGVEEALPLFPFSLIFKLLASRRGSRFLRMLYTLAFALFPTVLSWQSEVHPLEPNSGSGKTGLNGWPFHPASSFLLQFSNCRWHSTLRALFSAGAGGADISQRGLSGGEETLPFFPLSVMIFILLAKGSTFTHMWDTLTFALSTATLSWQSWFPGGEETLPFFPLSVMIFLLFAKGSRLTCMWGTLTFAFFAATLSGQSEVDPWWEPNSGPAETGLDGWTDAKFTTFTDGTIVGLKVFAAAGICSTLPSPHGALPKPVVSTTKPLRCSVGSCRAFNEARFSFDALASVRLLAATFLFFLGPEWVSPRRDLIYVDLFLTRIRKMNFFRAPFPSRTIFSDFPNFIHSHWTPFGMFFDASPLFVCPGLPQKVTCTWGRVWIRRKSWSKNGVRKQGGLKKGPCKFRQATRPWNRVRWETRSVECGVGVRSIVQQVEIRSERRIDE